MIYERDLSDEKISVLNTSIYEKYFVGFRILSAKILEASDSSSF